MENPSLIQQKTLKSALKLLVEKIDCFRNHHLDSTKITGGRKTYRFEVKIDNIDFLDWIIVQDSRLKIYWSGRGGDLEFAAVGAARVISENDVGSARPIFQSIRKSLNREFPAQRYFGGFRFNPATEPDQLWRQFGRGQFILPDVEIVRKKDETVLAGNLALDGQGDINGQISSLVEKVNRVRFGSFPHKDFNPALLSRTDEPDKKGWDENVAAALNTFHNGKLEKIVLGRRSTLKFPAPLNGVELLRMLKKRTANAYHFYFQPQKGMAFLGASSERLYRRNGRELVSEAVAGTRRRGGDEEENQRLATELLHSRKDIYEHALVCAHIRDALNRLCDSFEEDRETTILKAARVQHLYKHFRGVLKKNVWDEQIMKVLNPTPAVCGYPKEAAASIISQLENIDRGWYAAPVGWVGANSAEFAVAIRSALVIDNQIHLYSGAGIVPGSEPEAEWQEIEHKIENFLEIFKP